MTQSPEQLSIETAQPVTIVISGDPVGKGRHRATRTGVYTPAKTRNQEAYIKYLATEEMRGREAFDGPVSMHLRTVVQIPKSMPKYKRAMALSGALRPTTKPDASNIQKLIEDALNGVVYADDKQIVYWFGEKVYGERPATVVTIAPVEEAA